MKTGPQRQKEGLPLETSSYSGLQRAISRAIKGRDYSAAPPDAHSTDT